MMINGMAALPEDALVEIFSRVGNMDDLFRFAMTCKWWLRRFTDPAFLQGLCRGQGHREGHPARLILGFFFQETRFALGETMRKLRMAENSSTSAPTFLPVPGSPLGTKERSLTSFVADADGTFNYAEPLVVRRGLVVMNLIPRTFSACQTYDNHRCPLLFGVCSPATGERHVVPPLEKFSGVNVHACRFAIITAADIDGGLNVANGPGRFTFSQLLVATHDHESQGYEVRIDSYSAATRRWSAPIKCVGTGGLSLSMVDQRSAVIHQGAAHWLCTAGRESRRSQRAQEGNEDMYYKISVEAGTTRVSVTKLPIRAGGQPVLCVSRDDKLSVACVYFVHVTLWTQQGGGEEDDDDDGGGAPASWLRTIIRIPMAVPDPDYRSLWQHGEMWSHFGKGSLLLVYKSSAVFVLDLEEQVVEQIKYRCLLRGDERNRLFVPYELDLVEFFGCRRPAFLLDDDNGRST